ncbi:MAG TPA: HAD family hydrolase, partial [Firmicutes bacterium]|nr:HAD family hydrolase [Bacillota bacterium]
AGDTDCDKATNIKILMEKEGINEVIYVGDTLKDYEQSKKAGVQFIYASYGFGSIDFKVNKIDNLNELIPLISKIFNN